LRIAVSGGGALRRAFRRHFVGMSLRGAKQVRFSVFRCTMMHRDAAVFRGNVNGTTKPAPKRGQVHSPTLADLGEAKCLALLTPACRQLRKPDQSL